MNRDHGDAEQNKEQVFKAKLKQERANNQLKWVLSTEAGRAVIWRIMDRCFVAGQIVTDPLLTFRQLGRRDEGIELLGECFTADPNSYIVMRQEAVEREQGEG